MASHLDNYYTLPQREPVALRGAIRAAYTAVLAVVFAFGPRFNVEFTEAEIGALLGLAVVVDVVITVLQRNHAYPAEWVDDQLDAETVIASAERR